MLQTMQTASAKKKIMHTGPTQLLLQAGMECEVGLSPTCAAANSESSTGGISLTRQIRFIHAATLDSSASPTDACSCVVCRTAPYRNVMYRNDLSCIVPLYPSLEMGEHGRRVGPIARRVNMP